MMWLFSFRFYNLWILAIMFSSLSSATSTGLLSSSRAPIILNLNRVATNETGLIKLPKAGVRTKTLFFERTLGIESGKPFNFDIEKWKAIQRSGLFRNLTAKAAPVGSNEVILKISGQELPSIRFAPEVSVAASIDRPEVSGGLSFSDRNFRGLGQRFDFQITKKEGREIGTDLLRPTIVAKWTDNKIGKTSCVVVGYEEESRFEDGADILPDMRLARYMDLGIRARNRFETKIRKTFVKFRELDFLHFARNHNRNEQLMRIAENSGCQLDVELEPYRTLLSSDLSVAEFQGAKISANWRWTGGYAAELSHDGGVGVFPWGTAPYRQISGDASSPLFRILSAFEGTVKSTVTSAEDGSIAIGLPAEEYTERERERNPLQIMGKLKASAMSSWGGACLPLFHRVPLGDSLTVRSSADIPDLDFLDLFGNHKKRSSAFVALKGDMYLEGLRTFIPGCFLDCAVSNSVGVSEDSLPVTVIERSVGVGLSLRAFGFRIDAAWPLTLPKTPVRVHLGIDIGA